MLVYLRHLRRFNALFSVEVYVSVENYKSRLLMTYIFHLPTAQLPDTASFTKRI